MDKAKSGQNNEDGENLHCGACRSLIVDSARVDLEKLHATFNCSSSFYRNSHLFPDSSIIILLLYK